MQRRQFAAFRLIMALLLFGSVHPFICAADTPSVNEETNDTGDIRVHVNSRHGKRTETLLVLIHGRVYSMPDEAVDGYNEDESAYEHEFHLSPDQRWLFVTRKLYHSVDVAYLYHRVGAGTFVRVRPQGLRFDEAAVRFFSRRLHLGLPSLEAGARVTHFEGWTSNAEGLVFHFSADKGGPESERKHLGVTIRARYDLQTGQFSLISKTWSEFGGD